MRHKVVTQILLQPVSEAEEGARNVDPASKVAWNLFTSLYFKAGEYRGARWACGRIRVISASASIDRSVMRIH